SSNPPSPSSAGGAGPVQPPRHVREGLERDGLTLDRLRQAWLAISPMAYFDKFVRNSKKVLMIYAKYDLTFLPKFSRQVQAEFECRGADPKTVVLPCGHYTTGETPFEYIDGYQMVRCLVKDF